MRPIKNLFYVKADIDNALKHAFANGKEIYISEPIMGSENKMNFSTYDRAVQIGTIAYCPMKIVGFNYSTELKQGDQVLLHHFVVNEDNQEIVDGELYYKAYYPQIFGVIRNEELIPLHDYLFCVPVYESEEKTKTSSGLFLKSTPDQIPLTAKIVHAHKGAEEMDLFVGDIIKFMVNSDYTIKVGGKEYWRMNSSRVLAKEVVE